MDMILLLLGTGTCQKSGQSQAWQSSRSVWAALSGTCCHERAVTLVDGPVQGQKLDFDPCGSLSAQHILLVHESVIISEENKVLIFLFLLQNYPPFISSGIPFLGHAIAFGKSPIEFLENAYDKVCVPT